MAQRDHCKTSYTIDKNKPNQHEFLINKKIFYGDVKNNY